MTRPKPLAPTFVIDENMGSSVADVIVAAGGTVVLLTDRIDRGTEDFEFIPRLAEWGTAFLTRDLAMRTNEVERKALSKCEVHVFLVRAGGAKLDELQALVKEHYASMCNYVAKYATPFLAHVTHAGVRPVPPTVRRGGIRR